MTGDMKFDVSTTNPEVWARGFITLLQESAINIDEELMTSWFANAIMAGYDEARRKYEMTNAHEAILKNVLGL